ncbi:MAG: lipopolysaccharide biosynthesis protein [Candidatus Latescibacterota bacterium]|nr:MAG: lipopolysaccharide biosynthesis protein [Candidatus Latescibacterota bacterium]
MDRAALDRSLVQGLAWTGVAKWGSQILTWGATLIVARLLLPEHYGLVGMASIYLGLVSLVNEFGFGTAIISLRELSETEIAQLNTVSVLFGLASFALSFAAAAPLARFFRSPELGPVVVVMSAAFLVTAFRTVPQALLQRDLRFPRLAVIEGVQGVLRALVMIALAAAGLGYWTLVLGNVAGAFIWTGLTLAVKRHAFAVPRWSEIRSAIRFSWHILAARIGWYIYSHADFAVAGRLLGKGPLGSYSLAWSTAGMPVEKVTALVGRVTPGVFSAVQADKESLRRYLVTLTEGIALLTFPAAVGLALVADTLVPFVLGEQWVGAIVPLRILALYATFRSIITLLPQILNVTGETRFGMWNGFLAAAVLPAGFLVGARWGTTGIAASWVVLHPLVTLPVYWRVFRRIELPTRRYLRALWPSTSAVLAMAIAVIGAKRIEGDSWHPAARLALEVAVGAAVYAGVLAAFHGERVRKLLGALRPARPGARPSA